MPPVGAYAMAITPMDERGRIDEAALRRHLQVLGAGGVGVYLASIAGEGHLLRPEEIRLLYEIGVDELAGKVPVYASGVPFTNTDDVIAAVEEAGEIGLDGVYLQPPRAEPPMLRPYGDEIERFYREVLDAVSTPVFLSTQMAVVQYETPIELLSDLVGAYGHILGVNITHFDATYLVRAMRVLAGRTPVCVGVFPQFLTALSLGGAGVLCMEATIAPNLCRSVAELWAAGDLAAASDKFTRLLQLHEVLIRYPNPRGIKAAAAAIGIGSGHLRRPLYRLDDAACLEIAQAIDAAGIRGLEKQTFEKSAK
jgi:4-hydroxy-tetrahydrodipicolinate synthase